MMWRLIECHFVPVALPAFGDLVDCLEHKGDMSSFHNFTGDAKETFERVLYITLHVIRIIHCSCYNYKILNHLLTASAYEFTDE